MFGSSPPPTPDYTGAAREQSQASSQLALQQTYANRPDITTPWGSVTWQPPPWRSSAPGTQGSSGSGGASGGTGTVAPGAAEALGGAVGNLGAGFFGGGGGGSFPSHATGNSAAGAGASGGYPSYPATRSQEPGRWSMNLSLAPEEQRALEAQQRIRGGVSGIAEGLVGRAGDVLGQPLDYGNAPDVQYGSVGDVGDVRNRAESALYGRAASRLDPQWRQAETDMQQQLLNQGLRPGTEAYDRAYSNFARARNDAYQQANFGAITGGGEEAQRQVGMALARGQQGFAQSLQGRQQAIAEAMQKRGYTLNEIQALLGGNQVNMPQMPGFAQSGVGQAPNLLGAAGMSYGAGLNAYNAQQAQMQSLLSGGANLAALAFM